MQALARCFQRNAPKVISNAAYHANAIRAEALSYSVAWNYSSIPICLYRIPENKKLREEKRSARPREV